MSAADAYSSEVPARAGEDLVSAVKTSDSEVKTSLAAFASQLLAWRRSAGWTQVQLARNIGYSASYVSGIESMDKPPSAEFALACDRAFATPGFREVAPGTVEPGTLMTLQVLAAREAYPAWFAEVVPFEHQAARIHGWELGAVPGLLQTEDYARALIRVSRLMDTDSDVDKLVTARRERQTILTGQQQPKLWYVIDEAALRRIVGEPAVMAAQLDSLITAATTPGIVIQVLPFTADNPGTDGPITVYEFVTRPTVCYTECYAGGRIVEAPTEVADLITVMGLLRAAAVPPRQSLAMIRQIRSDV